MAMDYTAGYASLTILGLAGATACAMNSLQPVVFERAGGVMVILYLAVFYVATKKPVDPTSIRIVLFGSLPFAMAFATHAAWSHLQLSPFCSLDDSSMCRLFLGLHTSCAFLVYTLVGECLLLCVCAIALSVPAVIVWIHYLLAQSAQTAGLDVRKAGWTLTEGHRESLREAIHVDSVAERPETSDNDQPDMCGEVMPNIFPAGYVIPQALQSLYMVQGELDRPDHENTFEARRRTDGRVFAVKIFSQVASTDWRSHRQFGKVPRDIAVKALVQHDNIVTSLEVFRDELFLYVLEDLHSHFTLLDFIETNKEGWVHADHAKLIFAQLVSAVDHLHVKGMLHGNIDPGNVLIDRQLKVKLTGFGQALRIPKRWKGRYEAFLLDSKDFGGHCRYAVPEVHRGEKYYALSADIWALGMTLCHMVFGHLNSPSQFDLQHGKLSLKGYSAKAVANAIKVGPLLEACLQLKPAERSNAVQLLVLLSSPGPQVPLPGLTILSFVC